MPCPASQLAGNTGIASAVRKRPFTPSDASGRLIARPDQSVRLAAVCGAAGGCRPSLSSAEPPSADHSPAASSRFYPRSRRSVVVCGWRGGWSGLGRGGRLGYGGCGAAGRGGLMEQVAGEVCGRGARVWGFRVVWDGQKDARGLGQFWLTTIVSDIPKPLALILYQTCQRGTEK